jgi:hypothetical protein
MMFATQTRHTLLAANVHQPARYQNGKWDKFNDRCSEMLLGKNLIQAWSYGVQVALR